MAELSVLVEQLNGRCRVSLSGELDLSTAWRLRQELENARGFVEFDCSELTFVDSSGLALWMERLQRDGRVVLIGVSTQTHRVLEVCGLLDAFELRSKPTLGELPGDGGASAEELPRTN